MVEMGSYLINFQPMWLSKLEQKDVLSRPKHVVLLNKLIQNIFISTIFNLGEKLRERNI